MSSAFLRVVDGTGTVRLVAVDWIVSVDIGKAGLSLALGVPDGQGGLVSMAVTGAVDDLTRQMDGLADVWGLTTLPALVAQEHGKTGGV